MKRLLGLSIVLIVLFSCQTLLSQTWVRKVDGFSMWSIGKDYAGNIYAGTIGTNRGIFKSTDGGDTWNNMFSTGASNYLGIDCDSLNNVYVANVSNGLLISTDGGQNFTLVPSTTFNGNNVNVVTCGQNGHIFVGVTNGGIWRSTDFGATFTNTALQTNTIVSIAVDKFNSDIIYAGSSSSSVNGFFRSTDDGITFGSSTNDVNVWEILQNSSGDLYIATTSSPYPFDHSTDGGLTWSTMGYQPAAMRGATFDAIEDIYTAGNGGVFKSTDGGATFLNHNFTFSSNKILMYQNKIMVCVTGSTNGGVWIYTDESIPVELASFTASVIDNNVTLNWSTATETNNRGFDVERQAEGSQTWDNIGYVPGYGTTTEPKSYSFSDYNLTTGEYQYRLKQIDLDGGFEYSNTAAVKVNVPVMFYLSQNYPNPFNPATQIDYSIPKDGFVSLTIYNTLGQVVAEPVNEYLAAGKHHVDFNASALSSGIYFYRLTTDNNVLIRKMTLLK